MKGVRNEVRGERGDSRNHDVVALSKGLVGVTSTITAVAANQD